LNIVGQTQKPAQATASNTPTLEDRVKALEVASKQHSVNHTNLIKRLMKKIAYL